MKKILVFIGLKLAELVGVCILGYGLYWLGHLWPGKQANIWYGYIIDGTLLTLISILILLIGTGIFVFNWSWTEHIVKGDDCATK